MNARQLAARKPPFRTDALHPIGPFTQGRVGNRAATLKSVIAMPTIVRENNFAQALRALKKKLQRETTYREMKLREHFEYLSERHAPERAAAVCRARKADRKRAERDQ